MTSSRTVHKVSAVKQSVRIPSSCYKLLAVCYTYLISAQEDGYVAAICGCVGGGAGDGLFAVYSPGAAGGARLIGGGWQAAAIWCDRRPDRQLFDLHAGHLADRRLARAL